MEANSQDVTRPLERLTISFTDIEVQYTPYDQDGNPLPRIAVGFNTATNERRYDHVGAVRVGFRPGARGYLARTGLLGLMVIASDENAAN